MENKYIWFSDYDGTITNHEGKIDQRDIDFIKNFESKGHKFIIATGRLKMHLDQTIEKYQIPYDYIIVNNGNLIYKKDKGIIKKWAINFDERKLIVKKIKQYIGKCVIAYSVLDKKLGLSSYELEGYKKEPSLYDDLVNENRIEEGINDILYNPDLNVVYFTFEQDQADKEIENIASGFKDLRVVDSGIGYIEILPKIVSKANAIEYLKDELRINRDFLITSGDAPNDIEMLKLTDKSFVKSTAKQEVKECGKYVIDNLFEIGNYIDL